MRTALEAKEDAEDEVGLGKEGMGDVGLGVVKGEVHLKILLNLSLRRRMAMMLGMKERGTNMTGG